MNEVDWLDNRNWLCRGCGSTGISPEIARRHECVGTGPCECICAECVDGRHCDRASCAQGFLP